MNDSRGVLIDPCSEYDSYLVDYNNTINPVLDGAYLVFVNFINSTL
jgi:hypothetical protein